MAASFQVTVDDQDVRAALAGLADRAADLRPAWEEVGSLLHAEALRAFETETGPDGRRWPPLAAATLRRTPRRRGGQILQDTRRLLQSVTYRADAAGVTVGSNVVYAAIHQLGGRAGRGRKTVIPARPYLPIRPDGSLPPEVAGETVAILRDHLLGED